MNEGRRIRSAGDFVSSETFDAFKASVAASFTALHEDIKSQGNRIEDLVKAKQFSLPTMLAAVGLLVTLCGGAFGFAIKTQSDVQGVIASIAEHGPLLDEFRERLRFTEATQVGIGAENEAQHLWMADIDNLRWGYESQKHAARCRACESRDIDYPELDYVPLTQIGHAKIPTGGARK